MALRSIIFALFGISTPLIEAFQTDHRCDWPSQPQQLLAERPASCPQNTTREEPEIEPYSHSIWSSRPLCFSGRKGQYCTHTTSYFGRGSGLSVIASPKAAEAATKAFEYARKAPHYPHASILEMRDIPGKGKGLVARRAIEKGRIIMLDSPGIIASAQIPQHVTASEGLQLFEAAVDMLSEVDQNRIMSLDASALPGGAGVEDIVKTNAFACQIDDDGVGDGYLCLFPSVSRINHACRPNAHARFIPKTLLMEIKTLRDIAPGEEISISYGRVDMKHAERQKYYREGWDFTCTCDLCTADQYAIAGSDQRRARFKKLHEKLESLTAETYDAHQVIAWEKEVLDLSKKEGFEVLIAEDMERMAYVYSSLGQLNEARTWARKTRENLIKWTVVEGGPNNELKRVEELLRELGG